MTLKEQVAAKEREVKKLKKALAQAADALVWCGGSPDFAPGGQARKGWVKIRPVIDNAIKLTRGTPA